MFLNTLSHVDGTPCIQWSVGHIAEGNRARFTGNKERDAFRQ